MWYNLFARAMATVSRSCRKNWRNRRSRRLRAAPGALSTAMFDSIKLFLKKLLKKGNLFERNGLCGGGGGVGGGGGWGWGGGGGGGGGGSEREEGGGEGRGGVGWGPWGECGGGGWGGVWEGGEVCVCCGVGCVRVWCGTLKTFVDSSRLRVYSQNVCPVGSQRPPRPASEEPARPAHEGRRPPCQAAGQRGHVSNLVQELMRVLADA